MFLVWFVILKCSENLCRDFSQRSMIFFHFVFCVVFKVRLALPLISLNEKVKFERFVFPQN